MSGGPALSAPVAAAVRRARRYLCAAAGLLFAGGAVAGLALGRGAWASGLLGGAVAAALCLTGAVVLRWASRRPDSPAGPAAVDYLLKLVLSGATVVAAQRIAGLQPRLVAAVLLAGVVVSSGILAAVFIRARVPAADPDRRSDGYRGE